MRSWSVILGGQSSFDHAHVESLQKILGEILVCHTGGSIIFWPCTCWIFKKNSRWDPGLSYWGVNHLLTMHMLNLYKKILGEILVCHTGGVNHLLIICTCWIFKKNSKWDPGLSYWGVNHLLTMHMLNLYKKILGEILVCHTWGGQSSFDHAHVESLQKNSRWDPGLSYWGGQSSFDHAHVESLQKNSRWDPGLSYWGSQSSFDHAHVESLQKNSMRSWSIIPGGSIIFWPCACWIFKKTSEKRSWSVIMGGQSSFDHAHVESLQKNSRWDPGLSYWGVNHLLTMHMLNL